MPDTAPSAPLRYNPSFEHPEPDEAATGDELTATMRKITEATSKDYGHAVRSVHAKSHGLLRGELNILDGLAPELANGLFALPRSYPVVLRLSTNPGDILDDSVSAPRGLAVKVVGVEGERLPGAEGSVTQDFVLANAPAFQAASAGKFLGSLKPVAATTDTPQVLKKVISAALRGAEKVVESVGGESATLKGLGGQPLTHILGETFYSQAALLYGPYMAKLAIAPASPELTALAGAPLDLGGRPDGLRETVRDFFATRGGEWEVRIQLCTDLDAMPIEDPSVPWPEDASPYRAVGRIVVAPQETWSETRATAYDDGLAFSPWHGLAAHRPLGAINRVRRQAYEMSARFRSEHNRVPVAEPRILDDLPA